MKAKLAFALLVASYVVAQLPPSAQAEDKAPQAELPLNVLIVPEAVHARNGIGTVTATSVVDRAAIARLAAFFPKFQVRPSAEVAGAWEAGWQVYFNFAGGRTVRVIVSGNDEGRTWSTGDGDFATRGDFAGYLKTLKPADTKPKQD